MSDPAQLADKFTALEKQISELKRRQEVLAKLATAVERSPVSVMITNRAGKIEYVNPKFCQVTGYCADEVLGRNPSILKGNALPPEFYRELWQTILSGQEWHGEFHNRNKDGSMVWELASISPVFDNTGTITHFVGVKEDISELKRLQKELGQMAHSDQLTGLPNRALFLDRLDQVLIQARRKRTRFALMFIDLDGFKTVNDNHGHQTGDLLLQGVARRLTFCVRESDTVARMGGDEFIVILNDVKHLDEPGIVAHKLLDAFAAPFHVGEVICQVGLSIGISVYPEDAEEAQQLIASSDMAMYEAKRSGRNKYRYSRISTALCEVSPSCRE